MSLKLNIVGRTDPGKKRKKNEDSFVLDADLGCMIVADGMGGHASGEVASQLASTLCSQQLKLALKTGRVEVDKHVPENSALDARTRLLGDCVMFANQAVYEAAQASEANHNMGTTLVAALLLDNKLAIAHVGDSRLYLFRNGDLKQCTVDHSFIQEQMDRGLLKPEDAEKSDLRNMLTRSVGVSPEVKVDLKEIDLHEGDVIILCSDGLTKMLDDEQIEQVIRDLKEPEPIAHELIDRSNSAGGNDNVTVVIAQAVHASAWNRVKGILQLGSSKGGEK